MDNVSLERIINVPKRGIGLKTILTGCIAQIEKEKLLQESYIDYVYGNEDKFNIAKLLLNEEKFAVKDLMSENEFCEVVLDDTFLRQLVAL